MDDLGERAPDPGSGAPVPRAGLGRFSEEIVDQIRSSIRQGRVVAGDRLPSERELCDRFGVSRVTVREALRVLEASGLVDIRVGARGGAFVTAPSSRRVGEGIVDLFSLSTITALDVTEARTVLELGIVGLVCERATEADLVELEEICDRGQDAVAAGESPFELSVAWHNRFAQSAHNRAVSIFMASLHDPLISSLEQAREVEPTHGAAGVGEHRALVAAVRDRDAARARDLMTRHLARTAARVRLRGGVVGGRATDGPGSSVAGDLTEDQ